MSMSTHVIGFHPPNDKWKQMKAIWDSCVSAGVDVPGEVYDFFDGESPDERGVEFDLKDAGVATEWEDRHRQGYELEIAKLPPNITHIRFYNSW